MSKFTDALNSPLPSKSESVVTESFGMDDDTMAGASAPEEGQENCQMGNCAEDTDSTDVDDTDVNDISDSDNDDGFDPDSMSDDELNDLDQQLSGDALSSVSGDDEVQLTPDEEIQADDMMSMAATTLLVNDELNAEEKAEFSEKEAQTAVNEGFMTETDANEIALESGLVQEGKYTNKMIIRLDAASKKKQLYALAVNVSAAAHHDPDYIKLKKVMKMRKILRAKLENKYRGEATKRMKIYFNRLKHSKSNSLSKIGNKYSK